MDEAAVKDYVERAKSTLEASPQMDEEATKIRLIQPFIEVLGWDLRSPEVEPEHTVRMATGTTKVDFALVIGETPVVFIEAKPASTSLGTDSVEQLRSYMRQELDVDWGVVTNGRSFEVLTKGDDGKREEISLITFDLEDLDERPDLLEILTKEAIQSGKSDEIAKQIAQAGDAINYLRTNQKQVSAELSDVIIGRIGDSTPIDVQGLATEFIDDLISALNEQRRAISISSTDFGGDVRDGTDAVEIDTGESIGAIVGTIRREDIQGPEDATVAVFPTRESGIDFLRENNAWGFVSIAEQPEYVAMYVSRSVKKVKYFATVKDIVPAEEAKLDRPIGEYIDDAKFAQDKKVVNFEPGTLYELANPIPYQSKYPQSLRHTTLGKIRTAETTDDLF